MSLKNQGVFQLLKEVTFGGILGFLQRMKMGPLPSHHHRTQAEHCLFDQNPIESTAMEKTKIKKNGWVSWSEDEVKLLKKLFPRGRAREIAEPAEETVSK